MSSAFKINISTVFYDHFDIESFLKVAEHLCEEFLTKNKFRICVKVILYKSVYLCMFWEFV